MKYHPLKDYGILIRVRLREGMPGIAGLWEKIKARWFPHSFKYRVENIKVVLISAHLKVRTFNLSAWLFPASGFELNWQPVRITPLRALRNFCLSLLILPLLLGIMPKKALAAQEAKSGDQGISPLAQLPAELPGLMPVGEGALEVSDCPLKIKHRLLAATDCATSPHTFKLYTTAGGGTLNATSWSNTSAGTGHYNVNASTTWPNIIPPSAHNNAIHTNVHVNVHDAGWLNSGKSFETKV